MAGFDVTSILGMLSGDGVKALSTNAKADEGKVQTLVTAAVPLLLAKMQDNTASKAGASSLNKALSEHKDDDITDVASFLSNADTADGKKILGHILGDDQSATTKALSKKSGLTSAQTGKILSALAPLLLTLLGSKKDDDDTEGSGLGSLLGGILGTGSSASGLGAALLGSLLGGSNNSSSGLLGNLLGGSSESSGSSGLLGGLLGNLFGGKDEEKEE